MDNNALVSALDNLILASGVADRATCGSDWIVTFVFLKDIIGNRSVCRWCPCSGR